MHFCNVVHEWHFVGEKRLVKNNDDEIPSICTLYGGDLFRDCCKVFFVLDIKKAATTLSNFYTKIYLILKVKITRISFKMENSDINIKFDDINRSTDYKNRDIDDMIKLLRTDIKELEY